MFFVLVGTMVGLIAIMAVWLLGMLTGPNLDLVALLGALVLVLSALFMGIVSLASGRS